jgi:hypothetical protein
MRHRLGDSDHRRPSFDLGCALVRRVDRHSARPRRPFSGLGRRICLGAVGVDIEDPQRIQPFYQPECRVDLARLNFACGNCPVEPAPAPGRLQPEQLIANLLTLHCAVGPLPEQADTALSCGFTPNLATRTGTPM